MSANLDEQNAEDLSEGEMNPNETGDSDLVGFDFILENTNVNEEHLSKFEILGLL